MSDVLQVNVESLADGLDRAVKVMETLEQGQKVEKQESIGFVNVTSMLALFTPKRWELIETLRNSEGMSINALANLLKRNYKNVHTDVSTLIEWGIVQKNDKNRVYVPYSELIFDVKLPSKKSAQIP
jgi:predicted transcriptional regulator